MELLKGFKSMTDLKLELIIISKNIHYNELDELNIKFHIIERGRKKDPGVFLKIWKLYKKFKPEIIHAWGSMSAIYVLPTVILSKVKYINSMITNATKPKFPDENWVRSKITFPFSDVILTNSYAGIKAYKVSKKKAVVIHNGFNANRIKKLESKEEIKRRFNIKTPYVVGMVGAFDHRKDYQTFIEAAKELILRRSDITFIMIGDGPNLTNCKQSWENKKNNNIIFAGKQTDIESIVNVFNIGVLTTNFYKHKEGISNSIMEYMALGKPVIASRRGGTE